MITNVDAQSELFLADMSRVQRRLAVAEQEMSSGKKLRVASDGPDVVGDVLRMRSILQRNAQIQVNLGVAQTAAKAADGALSASVQLFDRALTLASQGVTGTQTAAGRLAIASDVQSLQDQLLGFSQTQSGGWYTFGGDQETQASYQSNLANNNGVDRLVTTSATRQQESPAGGTFAVAKTAQEIFDNRNPDDSLASDNAFAALNSLRVALEANDVPGISAAIGSIKLASDRLNASLSFYGTVQTRLEDAINFSHNYALQVQTEISQKEDADVVAASLEFNQGTVHLQAAFQMVGRVPHTTLFDFLAG